MALPAQVRKQAEAVNKLYEELDVDGEQQAGTTPDAQTPPVENTGAPSSADSEATTAPEPKGEEQSEGNQTDETFEQKYRTLQGMYNAELPRLRAESQAATTRVKQLEQLISTMNSSPAPKTAQAQAMEKLITEQDMEDYGESIDVMRKVFREEMQSKDAEINELRNLMRQVQGSVVPQVQQLAQRQATSSQQQFWNDLQAAVPDWREVNSNQDFQSWLLGVDPFTGIPRQTYLDDAQQSMDAHRVASFFQVWKGMSAPPDARTPTSPQPTSELERQVSPGRGRSGGTKVQGNAKTYHADDIAKFYADVQKGVYRGREPERDKLERDIFAAQNEGRIVNA